MIGCFVGKEMSGSEQYRRINVAFLITYFFLLVMIQVLCIFYIISNYKSISIEVLILLILFMTIIWPIVLSYILRKFFGYIARRKE